MVYVAEDGYLVNTWQVLRDLFPRHAVGNWPRRGHCGIASHQDDLQCIMESCVFDVLQ